MRPSSPALPVCGKPVHLTFDAAGYLGCRGAALGRDRAPARLPNGCALPRRPEAPERVRHTLAEMIRFRTLLIAAGYPDANDCDGLRIDPAFKMRSAACRRAGRTCARSRPCAGWRTCPADGAQADDGRDGRAVLRQLRAGAASDRSRHRRHLRSGTRPAAVGTVQRPLRERCFLPIHIYEATTGKPVAVILRPGKTPDGAEVMLVLRHVVAAIRRRWPRSISWSAATAITAGRRPWLVRAQPVAYVLASPATRFCWHGW